MSRLIILVPEDKSQYQELFEVYKEYGTGTVEKRLGQNLRFVHTWIKTSDPPTIALCHLFYPGSPIPKFEGREGVELIHCGGMDSQQVFEEVMEKIERTAGSTQMVRGDHNQEVVILLSNSREEYEGTRAKLEGLLEDLTEVEEPGVQFTAGNFEVLGARVILVAPGTDVVGLCPVLPALIIDVGQLGSLDLEDQIRERLLRQEKFPRSVSSPHDVVLVVRVQGQAYQQVLWDIEDHFGVTFVEEMYGWERSGWVTIKGERTVLCVVASQDFPMDALGNPSVVHEYREDMGRDWPVHFISQALAAGGAN